MTNLWMPGATRVPLPDVDTGMQDQYPSRVIAHITWSTARFEQICRYFSANDEGQGRAPHISWDPFTGEIVQFYPANSRSKSVQDHAGGTRTNRTGAFCIQIEAHFIPTKTMPLLTDSPCLGWSQINAWTRSLGILDVWPMGQPDWTSHRDESIWERRGGWYGHSQVPENTHTDPGPWPQFVKPTPIPQLKSPGAEMKAVIFEVQGWGLFAYNPFTDEYAHVRNHVELELLTQSGADRRSKALSQDEALSLGLQQP